MSSKLVIRLFAIGLMQPVLARGAVDTLTTLVTSANAVGGVTTPSALGAYGYDASTGGSYAIGFNGNGQDARQVTSGGSVTRLLTQTPYGLFTKGGDPNNGGGAATPGSLLLNPKAILNPDGSVAIPAYGTAVIADGAALVTTGTGASLVKHPELSRRVYRLDLYKFANGSATAPVADGNSVLTSLVTTAKMAALSGGDATASSNTSRQVAYSGDGQSVYFVDTSTAVGGLYKASVLTGALTRLNAAADNTEPAVLTVNGVDRVFLRGGAATNNVNGLDYVDASDGSRHVALAASALQGFFENTTAAVTTFSMTGDAAGNLYFNNTNTAGNSGIFRLDPQGRLIKLVGYTERKSYTAALGTATPNANTLRMQVRSATYNGFAIGQLTYAESGVNGVTGVNVFKPGDFDRDNAVTTADLQTFGSRLTVRGVKQTNADLLKYDLNGNDVIDFKDLEILQQFAGFSDGDATLDLQTDYADLSVLAVNYTGTGKTWIQGDLTGDDRVTYADLLTEAGAFTAANGVPGLADLTSRYTGQFLTDAQTAFGLVAVPEPASLAALGVVGGLLRRRRKGA